MYPGADIGPETVKKTKQEYVVAENLGLACFPFFEKTLLPLRIPLSISVALHLAHTTHRTMHC